MHTITLSVKCDKTGQTGNFVQFVREHHTIDTIDNFRHNSSSVVINDNYMLKVTPYFEIFSNFTKQVQYFFQKLQDKRKRYAVKSLRNPVIKIGQKRTIKTSYW